MIDLVYHILTNDAGVSAITTNVYADARQQTDATPGIVIEWVATDDEYALGGMVCNNIYTIDLIGYSKDMATAHNLLKAMRSAVNTLNGNYTTAAGNSYTVVSSEITDRNAETIVDLDVIESSLTVEITTQDTPS